MSRSSCSMAALVEAHLDGRLGEREAATILRHLRLCAACKELAADLEPIPDVGRVPVPELSPLEHQRGRMNLLQIAAQREVAPARRRWPAVLAVAALASGVVLLSWSSLRAPQAPAHLAQVSVRWNPPKAAGHARSVTTLMPEAAARFTRSGHDGAEIVTLEDGAVTFSVRHLDPQERFLVRTRDAEVEVRGTIFRVEALAGRIRAVHVTEGRVEVRFAGSVALRAAGESWLPPDSARMDPPLHAPPRSKADSPSARAPVAQASASSAAGAPTGSQPVPEPAQSTAAFRATEQTRSFGEAVRLFERGDYGAAAGRLQEFSAAHPSDSRAEDAAFLAVLALKRSGRSVEAAALARRYLERYPQGYRLAEAEAIAAGR